MYDPLSYSYARWIEGTFDPVAFERREGMLLVKDVELRPILLFASEWMVHRAVEKYPDLKFIATAQPPRRAGRR